MSASQQYSVCSEESSQAPGKSALQLMMHQPALALVWSLISLTLVKLHRWLFSGQRAGSAGDRDGETRYWAACR
jgi:hypothetical protein